MEPERAKGLGGGGVVRGVGGGGREERERRRKRGRNWREAGRRGRGDAEVPLSSPPVRCAPKGCPGQPGQGRAGLAGSSCPGPPMLGGEAEPDPRKPTGKAKRRWDGRAEISAVEEDGRRGLGMRAGERGGARPGKAAVAAKGEAGSRRNPSLFIRHLARPLTGWGGSLRIMGAVVRDWGRVIRPFPVVLPPADPPAEYAEFPWGGRKALFLPRSHPEIPPSSPRRGSAELFCSFQELKAV